MAYSALKYALTPHEPRSVTNRPRTVGIARAYSGDDQTHNEVAKIRKSFLRSPHRYRITTTGGPERYPHFCGTVNLPSGSCPDPVLLCLRVLFRLRSGTLHTSCLSYSELASRLQGKLEASSKYLDSRELSCHSVSVRVLRLYLRVRGLPLVGKFLVRLIDHWYSLPQLQGEVPSLRQVRAAALSEGSQF
jgi:hypothetical protein